MMARLPSPKGGGQIALPGTLLFLAGLAIIYITLRWRDEKHGTFGGFFSGTKFTGLTPPVASSTGTDTSTLPPGTQVG